MALESRFPLHRNAGFQLPESRCKTDRNTHLITQCRSSGLTDRQWCIENGIPVSTFYYHVRALRKKACEVPEAVDAAAQKQEVVQIPLWEREQHSDTAAFHTPSICLEMQGIRIEIHEQAGADVIRNTLLALRQLC